MTRLLLILSILTAMAAAQNWTTVSASNITDIGGNKLASGTISFLLVDNNNVPHSVQVGGGGQSLNRAYTCTITTGAIVQPCQVPNPQYTSPAGMDYRIVVRDTTTGSATDGAIVIEYPEPGSSESPVAFTGSTFDIDNYAPSSIPVTPPTSGSTIGSLTGTGTWSTTGPISGGSATFSDPSITPSSIETFLYADQFGGSDIGAKINAAIAALPRTTLSGSGLTHGCGRVIVPAGFYTYATTILKPRCVMLEAASSDGALLYFSPTSGVAIAAGDEDSTLSYYGGTGAPASNIYTEGGLKDLHFIGNEGTSRGLWLGGDPAGVVLPSADWVGNQTFQNVSFGWFGTGVTWGNGTVMDTFLSVDVVANGIGMAAAPGTIADGNGTSRFIGGHISESGTWGGSGYGVDGLTAENLVFFGTEFDFNTEAIYATLTRQFGTHIEQNSGLLVDLSTSSCSNCQSENEFHGSEFLEDASTGTDAAMFNLASQAGGGSFVMDGGFVNANHTVTNLIEFSGSSTQVQVAGLRIAGSVSSVFSGTPATGQMSGTLNGTAFGYYPNGLLATSTEAQTAIFKGGSPTNDNTAVYIAGGKDGNLWALGTDITDNLSDKMWELYDVVSGNLAMWFDSGTDQGYVRTLGAATSTPACWNSSLISGLNAFAACTTSLPLSGTTGTITGTALSSSCDSGTVSVTGAVVGKPVSVGTTDGTDLGGAFSLRASVTSTGTVTVYVCGTGTPPSKAYNVRVIP